jgi:hypothetical protein
VLFAFDLSYAGLFRLTNIPAENVQPLLMIECPRLLFPFAPMAGSRDGISRPFTPRAAFACRDALRLAIGRECHLESHARRASGSKRLIVEKHRLKADFRSTKSAVKMHTVLDLRGPIPTFIHILDGKMGDAAALDLIVPEAAAFYVMDRG